MDPNKDQAGSPPADSTIQPDDQSAASSTADVNADSSPRERNEGPITDSATEYGSGLLEAITEAGGSDFEADENLETGQQAETADNQDDEASPDALQEESEEPEQDEQKESEDETVVEAESEEDEGEKTEEESDANLPFGKHPRFKQIIRERNEYRNMAEEYRPHAEEFQKIESFMERNQLTNEEVAQGFQIMALMKHDPFAAREQLMRHLQVLDQVTGHSGLPQDLQQEVQQGYITEARAREIANLRSRSQFDQQRSALAQQQAEEREQAQRQKAAVEAQRTALNNWEADVSKRDPDYASMKQWVAKELHFLAAQQRPQTPEQAVQLAKQAYGNVKDGLRRMRPQRQAIRPGPSSGNTGNTPAASPEPQSYLDAVLQAADSK